MLTKLLKAKIHRATVTQTQVDYPGSVAVDPLLLEASGILVNEAVVIADCENGNRFETYVIEGERGSGVIGVKGAAARLTNVGNKVILLAFCYYQSTELDGHESKVILVDDANRVTETISHKTT
jgi:aspartate 1-decarboxylase